uniref:Very-long-chain (3R)-3-hydroxyacyl-CoA dehydratase n=1 Tax=Lygus hesperus TaxID=30085 RepID=A0A0A9ZC22_LYGHE
MALMEIVHSILGIVPSPIMTTFVQVMSRILVLWLFTNPAAFAHWSLYQLVFAWSLAEIPRYAFYLWTVIFPNTSHPYFLFYLRYTLFLFLYPCGISAEIIQG